MVWLLIPVIIILRLLRLKKHWPYQPATQYDLALSELSVRLVWQLLLWLNSQNMSRVNTPVPLVFFPFVVRQGFGLKSLISVRIYSLRGQKHTQSRHINKWNEGIFSVSHESSDFYSKNAWQCLHLVPGKTLNIAFDCFADRISEARAYSPLYCP